MRRTNRGRASSAAAVLLLCSAVAMPAAPQEADPGAGSGYAERIEVEIVNVDVWVADRQGNPVAGLGADEFTIFHDGQPVPITHFTEVRAGFAVEDPPTAGETAALGRPGTPNAAQPSHLIVYFDQSRLQPRDYAPLIRGLEELLSSGSVPPERVLILRQNRSLFVEAPFGSSDELLRQALGRLASGNAAGMDLEAETRLALEAIRTTWEQSQDTVGGGISGLSGIPTAPGGQAAAAGGGGTSLAGVVGGPGTGSGSDLDACGPFLGRIQPTLDAWARSRGQRNARSLAHLGDLATFLAGLPGIKTVLYLSDGLETRPGAALADYAISLCPGSGAELMNSILSEEMTTQFLALTRHANTNRVTIYALQAGGLRSLAAGDASSGRNPRGEGGRRAIGVFESSLRTGEQDGLGLIASETGGRAVLNRNELGPDLRRIGQDLLSYYSLAYEPPEVADGVDQRDHRIEVRVAGDSLSARYRRGYRRKDATRWLIERLEGTLNLGITDNPLSVRLGAGAVRAGKEGTFHLPLHVMVPVERLAFVEQAGSSLAEVTIHVLVRRLASRELVSRRQTFRLRGVTGATGWADLPLELDLAEGEHLFAVGVQDVTTREASFVSTTLQVGPEG